MRYNWVMNLFFQINNFSPVADLSNRISPVGFIKLQLDLIRKSTTFCHLGEGVRKL